MKQAKTWIPVGALWSVLALLTDGIGVLASFFGGYGLRSLRPHELLPLDVYWGLAGICVLCLWGILGLMGGYAPSRLLSWFEEWIKVVLALGLAFGILLVGAFFVRSVSLSRLVVGYAGILAAVSLSLSRGLLRGLMGWLRARGYGIRRVVWVGNPTLVAEVRRRLARSPQLGFELVAQVHGDPQKPEPQAADLAPRPDLEDPDLEDLDLEDLIPWLEHRLDVNEVWFAQPSLATAEHLLALRAMAERPARLQQGHDLLVRILPDVLNYLSVNLRLQMLDGIPLLTLGSPPLSYPLNRILKRGLDLIGAGLGLVILSPLGVGIALAIRLTDPGPIFYRQERVSLNGQHFWILKFRTMRVNAESEQQPGWTQAQDPRRTPLGIWLRRHNLDELPQLWNVLKGEMSLVGPRPERPYYVAQFSQRIPKYLERHRVKTGLTGWAQIHGLRGDTSIPDRTEFDLYYVENWSLLLDLRILALTIYQGIQGKIQGY